MHIVLVEPEIPANTGNVARTCALTGSSLHLIRPLGFNIDDRSLKRAGLDYWHLVKVFVYDSFSDLKGEYVGNRFFYVSTSGLRLYADQIYATDDFLVFGRETAGLPREMLEKNRESTVRIPMAPGTRSLNISNAVAVVLLEALRQQGFPGMF